MTKLDPCMPAGSALTGALILAAGASTRMGQPKLLLPWSGTSVLGHLIATWQSLGVGQITAVCAARDAAIAIELDRIGFHHPHRILNSAPEHGMFSSIQAGARWPGWRDDLNTFAIVLGDQPHLAPEMLRALLQFAAAHPASLCQPSYQGRPRHPVILPRDAFSLLKESSAEDLRDFLQEQSERTELLPVDDPALELDLDTPADYARAQKMAEAVVRHLAPQRPAS